MKGFFLSLVFWSMTLVQVCLAQPVNLVIEADTVELGQVLSIRIEQGFFTSDLPQHLGSWEVFNQTETTFQLQNFTSGLHRLPIFTYEKMGQAPDTISSTQLIVVQLPATVNKSESVRAIESPVTIPSTWRDWLPQITAICGAMLWALIWLLATIQQVGPVEKKLPPPSAKAQAITYLAHLNKENPTTVISKAQQIFRNYLAEIGMENARTISPTELRQYLEESEVEKESFREIVSKIENLDELRFSGEQVSAQNAQELFLLIQQFIESQPADSNHQSSHYVSQYGRQASGFSRALAGFLDIAPPFLVLFGLIMWPGFLETVSISFLTSEPISACVTGILAALLIRTITAWMTVPGVWQATPGMRLLKLSVVGNTRGNLIRPLFWLVASLPIFTGHIGAFSRSGQSLVDSFLGQKVRQYPREKTKT